ncbi:MAG: type I restriction endonuclease subunit R [Rhodospirillales bacterium]|nr:type I restriction endonuclease subunit R [Rhodospirillales bacterium]
MSSSPTCKLPGSVEADVGSEKRQALIAADLIQHAEARFAALDGKAMVVCMSRRICVALYDEIVKCRPEWHSDDDDAVVIKVVMTGADSDPVAWQPHIGKRPETRRELLAKRAKKPRDPLKPIIVRDMWLTKFNASSMHTMHVDKPMKGHELMQAIARYHGNAVTTVQVLDELIKQAQEIREARERGEESGLNPDKIAFYNAVADNQSARDLMGELALRIIAHESYGNSGTGKNMMIGILEIGLVF